ncbi:MAG TPA: NAD(P)/FAD-dependent oxidoreductase [Hydrogenophaga sp.]|uniref:NAD(P)/FAD-dependent oxidoreductase n=1 Tax=Hydrogenophaga sp. TaxID=1904254 RepID=UPI002C2C122C|nr:NAD(P)/FAD-dependent oxidoreductase [Hydrogenophaga sp.]HMN94230.1 NAD(P)/FAD-dependent oxidoreductase [Hydrogenophaga sp.]HMP11833.1 NAD(P)/FAD-dependent oxidoreductase [Hydrogenophaga sp.]
MAEPPEPVTSSTSPIETDAVVIGAGPVGLFQVFQLGLLDISSHVVDALPYPGGQPIELYPDKPIYDIPAVPVCTGRELTDALLQQIAPFGATFHLGQTVSLVERQPDGRFLLVTDRQTHLLCRSVFIAAGVGAFEPKRLKLPGIESFENRQLFYHVREPADHAGQHLVIVGGDEAAVHRAIEFAEAGPHRAASVTLVHRRDLLQTQTDNMERLRELHDAGKVRVVTGQVDGFDASEGRLRQLSVTGPGGAPQTLALDHLLVLQGLSPKLGPLTHWGLQLERKQLVVDTETCSTSTPGIFAVGDVNHYPGKKKLIVCGFHECVMAAYAAAPLVHPDQPVRLEYTTSSSRLHQLLGVAGTNGSTP